MDSVVFRCWIPLLLAGLQYTDTFAASGSQEPFKQLASTVSRYLSADAEYHPDDLITASQLEEIQVYLRRTQGSSLATHPKWRRRLLPDNAPLVKIFHSGGGPVLRKAAAKLGGYAELDRLSRSVTGRQQLQLAIESKSPDELVRSLRAELSKQKKKQAIPVRLPRIYTAAEFSTAVLSPRAVDRTTAGQAVSATGKQAR